MKKIMMTLALIFSLQGAALQATVFGSAWAKMLSFAAHPMVGIAGTAAVAYPAYSGLDQLNNNIESLPSIESLSPMISKLNQGFTLVAPLIDKMVQADNPTTFVGKFFKYMNTADAIVGTGLRWFGYLAAVYQLHNAINNTRNNSVVADNHYDKGQAIEVNSNSDHPAKKLSRSLTPAEIQIIKNARAIQQASKLAA